MSLFDYLEQQGIDWRAGINWYSVKNLTRRQAQDIKALCLKEERQCDIYEGAGGTYSGRFHE